MSDLQSAAPLPLIKRLQTLIAEKPWLIWAVLLPVAATIFIVGIGHEPLWYDESYTAAMASRSIGDIIAITAQDSHPPLYYIVLRLFALIAGRSEIALRLFSALGALALVALGAGPVRRLLGTSAAVCSSILFVFAPLSTSIAQEARMYTWTAFLITAAFCYGALALKGGKKKDWVLFALSGLGAAYCHYYGLLAAVLLYAGVFVVALIRRRERLLPWLICALASAAAYAPWLFYALLGQVSRVTANFWIQPPTTDSVFGIFLYPFSNKWNFGGPELPRTLSLYFLLAVTVGGLIAAFVSKKEGRGTALLALAGYLGVIAAGIVASIVIRPVLVDRYTTVGLGMLFLCAGYAVSKLPTKFAAPAILAVFLGIGVPQQSYLRANLLNGGMDQADRALPAQLREGDIFVHGDEHTFGTFMYYFPEYENVFFLLDARPHYSNYRVFEPGRVANNLEDAVGDRTRIWLIDRPGSSFGGDLTSALAAEGWFATQSPYQFSSPAGWYQISAVPMVRVAPR